MLSGVDVVIPEESGEWSVLLVLTGGREVRMISPAMNYISPGPGVATLLMVVTVTTFVWSSLYFRPRLCVTVATQHQHRAGERGREDMSCYQSDRTELCKSNFNINLTDVRHFQIHLI